MMNCSRESSSDILLRMFQHRKCVVLRMCPESDVCVAFFFVVVIITLRAAE